MHQASDYGERIWALARGTVDGELERHVADCAECQDQLTTLRHVARYMQITGGAYADPPAALVSRLDGLMRRIRPDLVAGQSTSERFEIGALVRRVMASLVLDTGLTPQVSGLRATTDNRTRQLLFESDVADLDIELARNEAIGGWTVVGQLGMDHVSPGSMISFIPAEHLETTPEPSQQELASAIRVAVSVDGYFTGTLSPGNWVALVEVDDAIVVFGEIRL